MRHDHSFATRLSPAVALFALVVLSLRADDVIITSTIDSNGTPSPCPRSCRDNLGTTTTSATYSTAIPGGVAPRRTRYGISSAATWEVTPPLQCQGVYRVYVTKGTSASCPSDILVTITAVSGCTLADTNYVPQASVVTAAFQDQASVNVWTPVCIITNLSATPTIRFSWAAGGTSRWYMDAVRFQGYCPCPYIPMLTVIGPLVAGQTSVEVTNIAAGATNITVYANTLPIGTTNSATTFNAGRLTVSTAPLATGTALIAGQMKQGCCSALPASGPIVEPFLITSPYTGTTALWGRSATLAVTVTGLQPPAYQWFKNGLLLDSATDAIYCLSTVALEDAGPYSVVVSNSQKCVTNSGPLTVKAADLAVCLESGACAGISITGAVGYSYQMQSAPDLGVPDVWLPLTNLTLEHPVQLWLDSSLDPTTNARRFYRVLPLP